MCVQGEVAQSGRRYPMLNPACGVRVRGADCVLTAAQDEPLRGTGPRGRAPAREAERWSGDRDYEADGHAARYSVYALCRPDIRTRADRPPHDSDNPYGDGAADTVPKMRRPPTGAGRRPVYVLRQACCRPVVLTAAQCG
jgi:hypothetical protein